MSAKKTTKKVASAKAFSIREVNKAVLAKKQPVKIRERINYINSSNVSYETDLPIPEPTGEDVVIRRDAYPLAKLLPNQSFSYPMLRCVEQRKRQRTSLVHAITAYQDKNPKAQFVFRMLDTECVIRVWRTEDKTK